MKTLKILFLFVALHLGLQNFGQEITQGQVRTDGYEKITEGAFWNKRPEAKMIFEGSEPPGFTVFTLDKEYFVRFVDSEHNEEDKNYIVFPKGSKVYTNSAGIYFSAKCGNQIEFIKPVESVKIVEEKKEIDTTQNNVNDNFIIQQENQRFVYGYDDQCRSIYYVYGYDGLFFPYSLNCFRFVPFYRCYDLSFYRTLNDYNRRIKHQVRDYCNNYDNRSDNRNYNNNHNRNNNDSHHRENPKPTNNDGHGSMSPGTNGSSSGSGSGSASGGRSGSTTTATSSRYNVSSYSGRGFTSVRTSTSTSRTNYTSKSYKSSSVSNTRSKGQNRNFSSSSHVSSGSRPRK